MARSSACLDFLLLLFSSDSIAFPFYFFSFLPRLRGFVSPPDVHWRRNVCSRGGDVLSAVVGFIPHPRLKQRQKTCGRPDCRHKHKQKCNQEWRTENPDYFRGVYALQKEKYGTRFDYRRCYRQQHPDYVRRNAVSVRKWRERLRSSPVSSTSPDLHVTIESEKTSIRIAHVSSTSRDIFVTLNTS